MTVIIPQPASLLASPGHFAIPDRLNLVCGPGAEEAGDLLAGYLQRPFGGPGPAVRLTLRRGFEAEEYELEVRPAGVSLSASTAAGLVHGVQTLRQLESGGSWPCVHVRDKPALGWRGVMLDVARHFMPIGFLREFTDQLAYHKLNVLHLHLTDDQGWRIEIDGLPRLTEIGAWRTKDGVRHGGYYTAAELRGLVRYAAERGVTVVPEIDMPGHMRAAIAAYPRLGNRPDQELPVWTNWGVSSDVLGVHDEALDFCRQVLTAVMDIFPSRYVHVGGDECPPDQWAADPAARERAASLGLTDAAGLRAWFLGRMHEFLAGHDRVAICWDETGELPGAMVRSAWRDAEYAVRSAGHGHQVIMAPHLPTFFDYPQTHGPDEPPRNHPDWVNTLADVLAFDPTAGLPVTSMGEGPGVLGTQAQIWTEHLPTPDYVLHQAYPRLCGFAEVAWTGTPSDPSEFGVRLDPHLDRLRTMGAMPHRDLWWPAAAELAETMEP